MHIKGIYLTLAPFLLPLLLGVFADLKTVIITFFLIIKKNKKNLRLNDRSIQTAGESVRVNIVQSRERQTRVTQV